MNCLVKILLYGTINLGGVHFAGYIFPGIPGTNTDHHLEHCYDLARQNYPLIKKHDLIARSSNYSIENAGKLYLPQFFVSGFASYQSQTINFQDVIGGPGVLIPPLSKDQYKVRLN
jgi:hypothetical protein